MDAPGAVSALDVDAGNPSPEPVDSPVSPALGVGSCPGHHDPCNALENDWTRPRRFGDSRLAKVILVASVLMTLYAMDAMYTVRSIDPQINEHLSLVSRLINEGKDLIQRWTHGTTTPR